MPSGSQTGRGHAAQRSQSDLILFSEYLRRTNDWKLGELLSPNAKSPLTYPDANVPQAWAASATARACEILGQMSGLRAALSLDRA